MYESVLRKYVALKYDRFHKMPLGVDLDQLCASYANTPIRFELDPLGK